jgi:DNA modification methylase
MQVEEIKRNNIYLGDCLELMPMVPDKSVDAIICDLPFGYTANGWDQIIPFDKMWEQYERLIKDDGNIILFCSGMFTHKLALSNEKLYRYELIWQKSKCGSPFTAKYMPLKKHENILVFGKSAAKYNPQLTEGTPYKRNYTPNKTNNMKYGIKGVSTDNKGTRHPGTVLDFPQQWRRQDQVHPTQKPVELMEWLIKSYTNPGDLVLDNCCGSGTTCLAAYKTGRDYIGMEIEEEYYNIALDRMKEEQKYIRLL